MTIANVRGYGIHLYTTSTLLFVVLAAQWILEGHFRAALAAMAVTIVIDATDGALARHYRIKEAAPGIDGALLDNVVDFLSYAFLPVLFMLEANLLTEPVTLFATLVMFSSAFGFSRTSAKLAEEGFFVGFPSYWNVVVFYLYLLDLPPAFNTAFIAVLALLVFTRMRFLYVSRLRRGRLLHFTLGTLWGGLCLAALIVAEGPWRSGLLYVSLLYVVYYAAHSWWLARRTPSHADA